MNRRLPVALVLICAVIAALVVPAGAQERRACGNIVPDGYNLIESQARFIIGTPGPDFICADNSKNTIRGKGGNDIIIANGGNDVIYGGYGHDEIYGGRGHDRIYAGGGRDMVFGDDGNDIIFGGQGWDDVYGREGDDRVAGGSGNDLLVGGGGNDRLVGNQGQDDLRGSAGNDVLWGGIGDDELEGALGDDVLVGGANDDELDGGEGDDILRGLDGNDVLVGGEGANSLHGGPGADNLNTYSSLMTSTADGGPGIDACTFEFAGSRSESEEVGCENWYSNWFDPLDAYDRYDVLIVEHHVEGAGQVPAGMVHVRAEDLGWGSSPFYEPEMARLVVRKAPYTQDFRTFTESIGTGRNNTGFFGKSFRKQLSAITAGQGRLVELQTPDGIATNRLQVHLTGAVFNPVANTLDITGTPGKEVTVVVRDDSGRLLDVIHRAIASAGPLSIDVDTLPDEFLTVDVMRFDITGDYEIFPSVIRNVGVVHELDTASVWLTDAPNGAATEVQVEVYDGQTLVESGALAAANDWRIELAAVPSEGMLIRATLPGSLVKSLLVANVELTDVTGTLVGEPRAAGTGPGEAEIRIEMWDLNLGRDGIFGAEYNFRWTTYADGAGVWDTDGYSTTELPPFLDPGIAAEILALDIDGDRLLRRVEWPGHS